MSKLSSRLFPRGRALDHVRGADALTSSLMDTCLVLRNNEPDDQHRRTIHVLKSRGMGHSSRVRRFALTDRGVEFRPLAESGISREPSDERPRSAPRRRAVSASS
jgi:KaiC/GvpD/RAD55 family RecA-like ATPase